MTQSASTDAPSKRRSGFGKFLDNFHSLKISRPSSRPADGASQPPRPPPLRPSSPEKSQGALPQAPVFRPSTASRPAAQSWTWQAPQHVGMPEPILIPPRHHPAPLNTPLATHAAPPPPMAFPVPPTSRPSPQPGIQPSSPSSERPAFFIRPPPADDTPPSPEKPFPPSSPLTSPKPAATPSKQALTPSKLTPSGQVTPSNKPSPSNKLTSTGKVTPSNKPSSSTKVSASKKPSASTKPPSGKPGSADSPPNSLSKHSERCHGTTQAGRPCTRKPMKTLEGSGVKKVDVTAMVEEIEGFLGFASGEHDEEPAGDVPRFCHQHYQKVQAQTGGFFGKSVYVEYSDWIADELSEATQCLLKTEMARPPSDSDGQTRGYLYCHEMRPGQAGRGGTYIKLGRSVRPVARLGQWHKQCPSRQPLVRGFFPEAASGEEGHGYLDGAQAVASEGIRFHRKWERLCLIELAGWADVQRKGGKRAPCVDCGRTHCELFELNEGSFEQFVKPMVQKWQKWCLFAYV